MADKRDWQDHLTRWPLLLSGMTLLTAADLTSRSPTADPWIPATLMAVGCVQVGAGMVLVAWGHRDPTRRDPSMRTRASDIRTPANRIPDTQRDTPPEQ